MNFIGRSRAATRFTTGIFVAASVLLLSGACFGALRLSASTHQNAAPVKEDAPNLKPFVGTWKAAFRGQVFATLTLKEQDGKLSGTLNNFDVVTDKEGNLIDGTHADDGNAPLLNVHFKSGALYFVVLEKDQYSAGMNWKFMPLNAQAGTLTPLLDLQDNIPPNVAIKPIQMLRVHTKP